MIQFYIPDIAASPLLPEEEAAHALRVLRKDVGDEIVATDGKGYRYTCRISSVSKKSADLEVIDRQQIPLTWNTKITLAVAPTKNMDRMEWLVEKSVELGVNRIVFINCDHSERKIVKAERIRKIMVSAMKQSLKATLPELEVMVSFSDFIKSLSPDSRKYIAYCIDKESNPLFVKELELGGEVVVMIGPEGDFSQSEIELAISSGATCVSLGESRLRTETAALFSVAQIHTKEQIKETNT